MAELVDALDSKSSGSHLVGSIPILGTKKSHQQGVSCRYHAGKFGTQAKPSNALLMAFTSIFGGFFL
jgi:hypothetical protein